VRCRAHIYVSRVAKWPTRTEFTSHGPSFIINHTAGMTVGVYSTQREALREIEAFEQDDLMLETARSLVKSAVDVLVQTHNIDRRAAHGWIREAAE
jgi:hypothetical protein